jgi:beta-glucosidase-like glycosyl hydrolase
VNAARELERTIGAVLAPSVRSRENRLALGASEREAALAPLSEEYLERFPPRWCVAFGRGAAGASAPERELEWTRERLAREPSASELLVACDLEQGAGLHFPAQVRLPPALALAACSDAPGAARLAGRLTGEGARAAGVALVLAPVADLCTQARSPIVGVRSFGDDPARAASLVGAFLEGLHEAGVAGCAKHFPGHGDSALDSHAELPHIALDRARLERSELRPFERAVAAGVEALMIGHLDVPALTGRAGLPCTLSRAVIQDLARERLRFDGAVVSDAMDMGALEGARSPNARALSAGVDLLLCPRDPLAAAEELLGALERGELARADLERAAARVEELARRALRRRPASAALPPLEALERAAGLARSSLLGNTSRWPWKRGAPYELLHPLVAPRSLEARSGLEALRLELAGAMRQGTKSRGVLLPAVGEIGALGGRAGPDAAEREAILSKLAALAELGWPAAVLWLATPKLIPQEWWQRGSPAILCAFAPTPGQLTAAREWLQGKGQAGGRLPAALG